MNGLAGPLHGLANQEVIKWIFELREQIGSDTPTKVQIEEYVKKTLSEGKLFLAMSCSVKTNRSTLYCTNGIW